MKNYLGNLIARHLNQAEVLQPRLASQFEPQSSVFQAETEAEAEEFQPQTGADHVAMPEAASPEVETSATEFPLAPNIAREPVQPPQTTETILDSSVSPPAPFVSQQANATAPASPGKSEHLISVLTPAAEAVDLNEPAIVLTGQREKTIEPAGSNTPSTQRAEVFASETPVAATEAGPLPVAPSSTPKTQRARTMDPVAVTVATEDVEERLPVEFDPPHSNSKHSARARSPRPSQIVTPSSTIDLQPQVSLSATGSAKKPAVPNSISRPTAHTVAAQKARRDTKTVTSQHKEAPAGIEQLSPLVLPPVVTHAPTAPELPASNAAEKQFRVSPAQPKQTSPETRPPHQTQRVPFFETRELSASQNQAPSVRQKFIEEDTAADVGPTVNVTIGRIEVRAATQIPEAQPQKQRREHQVLSLDEYLTQRSAGGR